MWGKLNFLLVEATLILRQGVVVVVSVQICEREQLLSRSQAQAAVVWVWFLQEKINSIVKLDVILQLNNA